VKYYAYGERLPGIEVVDPRVVAALVHIARHGRLSRVKRTGQRGRRGWVLTPRNREEQFKRPGRLRK
jgi:hypothetical protein